jgi:predicted  nucleic acid-binding Zn-ribbon protein
MQTMMRNVLELQTLEFGEIKAAGQAAVIADLRGRIPLPILERYDRMRARGKKGVAAVRNQVCGSCHMQVSLGVVMALRHGQAVQLCENCGRYLYLAEEPVVAAAPATPPAPKPVRSARRRKTPQLG